MENSGITIHGEDKNKRIHMKCEHQSGLIYIVPSESNWVCQPEHMPAHSLAGMFKDIALSTILPRLSMLYLKTPGIVLID